MISSVTFVILLLIIFAIIFLLIAKDDLGIDSIKTDKDTEDSLVEKIAIGFPGSNILSSKKVDLKATKEPNLSVNKETAEEIVSDDIKVKDIN